MSGGGGPREARTPASGAAGHPEPPRPPGDSAGAPGPRTASAELSGRSCGSNSGCADTSAPEPERSRGTPSWRKSHAPGQPSGLALTGPLNPQALQQQLAKEEEEARSRNEGGDEQQEAPPGEESEPRTRVGVPDGLVLDVLGQRRPPPAKRQVFCSVFCVENDLPEVPSAERLSLTASSPPRAPPVINPPSTPSSFPSPAVSPNGPPVSRRRQHRAGVLPGARAILRAQLAGSSTLLWPGWGRGSLCAPYGADVPGVPGRQAHQALALLQEGRVRGVPQSLPEFPGKLSTSILPLFPIQHSRALARMASSPAPCSARGRR